MDTRDAASTMYESWRMAYQPRPGDVRRAIRRAGDFLQRPQNADMRGLPVARSSVPPSGGSGLWAMGLLMGAAAMYLFDAENGERRRTTLVRRVEWYRAEMERSIDRESGRVLDQLQGTARGAMRRLRESLISDDAVLRDIQAAMEELLPFEEAAQIRVAVHRGRVIVEGEIAVERHNRLLGKIATTPGVRGLDNRLVARGSPTYRSGAGGSVQ